MQVVRKLFRIIVMIIIIFICGFENIYVYARADYAAKAGDVVFLPDLNQHPQWSIGNLENEIDAINWHWDCRKLYDDWRSKGKPTDENDLCYISVAGVNWIFVAVAETFGTVGDYIKVHSKDEKTGQEADYYMMVFDTKSIHDRNAYMVNGVHYGHTQRENGRNVIDVLEFPYHGSGNTSIQFRRDVMPVMYIMNGGNYFEHPEGPVGFSAIPNVEYEADVESSTLIGAIGQFFRNIWNSVNTFVDNHIEKENKSTLLFDLTDGTNSNLVWPLPGHTRISSPFGPRKSPTSGASDKHKGIDIGAGAGAPEVAAGTGTLVTAGYFTKGSGYQCYLDLDDTTTYGGLVRFGYLHSSPKPVAKSGDHVYAGQQITTVGPRYVTVPGYGTVSNGTMTGTHLHFSMRIKSTGDWDYVDPEIYFPEEMRK